jgi:hypothetical protein
MQNKGKNRGQNNLTLTVYVKEVDVKVKRKMVKTRKPRIIT